MARKQENIRIVGIAHSKLRNAIGMVGIEVDQTNLEIHVMLARHWTREQINQIAPDVAQLFKNHSWSNTIIDLRVGQSVIDGLKRAGDIPMKIIFIKKKVDDVSEIRRVKQLDLIEMVQFMLQLKLDHKLVFPKKPSETMQELESQIALYSEHTSEAGSVDYYSPGDELDNLTKSLIVACFSGRSYMQDTFEVVGGAIDPKPTDEMELLRKAIEM